MKNKIEIRLGLERSSNTQKRRVVKNGKTLTRAKEKPRDTGKRRKRKGRKAVR